MPLRARRHAAHPFHPRRLAVLAALLGAAQGAAQGTDAIQVNQLGFLPGARKLAVVAVADGAAAARFAVRDAAGRTVLAGPLGAATTWAPSGQPVRVADFSALRTPGTYRIAVDGVGESTPFPVSADAYRALDAAAVRAYTMNRAGIALDRRVAGPYARAAGHPDDRVLVHASAASAARPARTVIASPKGWYDAGDYNKYVVNSGISTWTLLAAYAHFPAWFDALALDLPEDAGGGPRLPGLVHEVLWNLDWMATMQDPQDGGVYHKLTNQGFDGMVMPDRATAPRYVVQKTTAAALDFAATLAAASRVLARFDTAAPGRSARWLAAAERAWQWALAHPDVVYRQPDDIRTGTYGDDRLDDEFAWAAAELLAATGKAAYRDPAPAAGAARSTQPDWGDVRMLGWIALAGQERRLPDDARTARRDLLAAADTLLARWQASPYRLAMADRDFVWGSNAVALNQALVLVQAYRFTQRRDYLDAAQSALDYTLGRNPLGTSYVTGFGARAPRHPHHRPSVADGIAAPVPGWLVGGPNPGRQDAADCKAGYRSALPALAWLDDDCSYASNEVAINWNAPLVYVAAALQVLQR
ncbi:glycoside hydrolase family 9 protein [uncultured Massilia sp.]|uniref:glycoside hydrolase family 9 protein n=1 Tax=uncultured Massilia sp. TaxID=169973 RepID=UPI0025FCA331|nr:glycoside hydrolase family 9 protein [uncultured Massilia sp.]